MQGDTLSPYRFITFLDPLLHWLEKDNLEYHLNNSTTTCNTKAYANDLAIITNNLANIQPQIHKLQKISKWAHLDLTKCAIIRSPKNSNSNQMYSKPTYKPKVSYLETSPSLIYSKTRLTYTWAYILSPHSNGNCKEIKQ